MKESFIALCAAAFGVSAYAANSPHFDPPDLNYEYQLHRQYLGVRGQKSAVKTLNENYRLQKGETLRSLSEMLYGDGQYWPRVWAQSKDVANPHLVRQGHQLQFLLGSEDNTPAFRFSEEESEETGLELVAANGQNSIVEIPPPEVPPKAVLKVPASFPEWQSVYKRKQDVMVDDRGLLAQREKIPDRIYLRGYVQDKPVSDEAVGSYLENDSEAGLPIPNQYVYVKVKKGFGRPGMKMLVVTDGGRLKRLNKQWDPDNRPYLVQIMAEIELREVSPARRMKGGDDYEAYRALVLKTTGLSAKDCILIPGQLQMISLEDAGPSGEVDAQVIGSEKHSASALFAPGDLVFLNRGSAQGVSVGQRFDVVADRTIRRAEAVVEHSPASSGIVKVVKVNQNVSTAVLLSAFDSIQQGDLARRMSVNGAHDHGEELEGAPVHEGIGEEDIGSGDDF